MALQTDQHVHLLFNHLFPQEDANVVLVCWKYGAGSMWYPNSAANTRVVGAEVALLIDRLKKEGGMYADKTWCIGFSLGAHTCGFAGYRTQIQRITGQSGDE